MSGICVIPLAASLPGIISVIPLDFQRVMKTSMTMQEPPIGESTTTERVGNYQLLAVMLLKLPNGQHKVAVDYNQLRTTASKTADPIEWPLPPPFTGQ